MRREKKDQILAVLPEKIRGILLNHGLDFEKIQEIRLREEQPLAVKKEGKEELFTHRVTKKNCVKRWNMYPIILCMPMKMNCARGF